VLTLDIEMPRMDGIEFLKRLMPQFPIPVIIVSAMAAPGARATLQALENGAVDFVLKPQARIKDDLTGMLSDLREKVKIAAGTNVAKWLNPAYKTRIKRSQEVLSGTTDKVIAVGASTGGTVAIRKMISEFPPDMPGTVIVQHMPPVFTKMFAESLNEDAVVKIKEAEDGDRILTGRVLIAPGDKHLEVHRSGGIYIVKCVEGEKVNGHCPSVEVLFNSVAKNVGNNAVGVMLTGMGRDGAAAMLEMKKNGARTLAQDEKSSIVFGMPKEAWLCGGAEKLVSLDNMTREIIRFLKE
jgi:two-component system chemotaxis response regulator CheB